MLGAFRPTATSLGGLLWKMPWRMSKTRKLRHRARMQEVDHVISTLAQSGVSCHNLERAMELPLEAAMPPKDKYTVFSRHSRGYRKGLHKVPKWTRVTQRTNPTGF